MVDHVERIYYCIRCSSLLMLVFGTKTFVASLICSSAYMSLRFLALSECSIWIDGPLWIITSAIHFHWLVTNSIGVRDDLWLSIRDLKIMTCCPSNSCVSVRISWSKLILRILTSVSAIFQSQRQAWLWSLGLTLSRPKLSTMANYFMK